PPLPPSNVRACPSARCVPATDLLPLAPLTLLSLLLLVSPDHGHHPHLPSFPTRRSSDLPAGGTPPPTQPTNPARIDAPHRSNPIDRKSTRLNSSHGSISYAVFCLKKKTPPARLPRPPRRRPRRPHRRPRPRRRPPSRTRH